MRMFERTLCDPRLDYDAIRRGRREMDFDVNEEKHRRQANRVSHGTARRQRGNRGPALLDQSFLPGDRKGIQGGMALPLETLLCRAEANRKACLADASVMEKQEKLMCERQSEVRKWFSAASRFSHLQDLPWRAMLPACNHRRSQTRH